jgi:hypothetical protein
VPAQLIELVIEFVVQGVQALTGRVRVFRRRG